MVYRRESHISLWLGMVAHSYNLAFLRLGYLVSFKVVSEHLYHKTIKIKINQL